MKRRTLLCMPLLGFFSSVTFSKSAVPMSSLDSQTRVVFNDLSKMFVDRSNAASIGREYLSAHPHLDNSEQLLSNLGVNTSFSSDDNLSLFEARRADDYRLSNIVNLDGWVLSMAEVSLCCATSLLLTNS